MEEDDFTADTTGIVSEDGENNQPILSSTSSKRSSEAPAEDKQSISSKQNTESLDMPEIPQPNATEDMAKCVKATSIPDAFCPLHGIAPQPCAPGKCVCCTCNQQKPTSTSTDRYYYGLEDRSETEMGSMFQGRSSSSLNAESLGSRYSYETRDSREASVRRRPSYMGEKQWLGYLKKLSKGSDEQGEGEMALSEESRYESDEEYMKLLIQPFDVGEAPLSSTTSSYVSYEEDALQRTIVIVKPEAIKFKETIFRVIFEAGFQILGYRVLHLSPEQVSEIYSKHYGSPSFVQLIVSVSEAPVLVICISAIHVIKKWLRMIGPSGSLLEEWFFPISMRKLFGLQQTHADWLHGSESIAASNRENRYFFPGNILEPLLQEPEKVRDYCDLYVNPSIVEACTELVKKRPADPIIYFADYLLSHNRFQPRFPQKVTFTPT